MCSQLLEWRSMQLIFRIALTLLEFKLNFRTSKSAQRFFFYRKIVPRSILVNIQRFRSSLPANKTIKNNSQLASTVMLDKKPVICNLAPQDKFSSPSLFKYLLHATYFTLLDTTYDIDMPCTWFLFRNCPCHRS